MRTPLIAFLILLLLGGQMGMLSALLIGHRHAQHRMLRSLAHPSEGGDEAKPLEYLIISHSVQTQPESSFQRIDEREFRYQGELYDIVHAEWRGSDWHVWALHDRQEERYLEALTQTLEPMLSASSTKPTQRLQPAYQKLALLATASHLIPMVRTRTFPLFDPAEPDAPCLEVPHPPPWG